MGVFGSGPCGHLGRGCGAAVRHAGRGDVRAGVVAATVDRLRSLAGGGHVLEMAIGTGRVAVPLAAAGVSVSGIELSQPMIDQLRTKLGESSSRWCSET